MSAQFIAFHSMIDESGKSSLAVKTARTLAARGKRVLLMDGYLYDLGSLRHHIRKILGASIKLENGRNFYDLIEDYIALRAAKGPLPEDLNLQTTVDYEDMVEPDLADRVQRIPGQENIDFLAGNNGDVLEIKPPFDFDALFDDYQGKRFFDYFKQSFQAQYDFILCDAHSGFDTLAGIVCGQVADTFFAVDVEEEQDAGSPSYKAGCRLMKCADRTRRNPEKILSVCAEDEEQVINELL